MPNASPLPGSKLQVDQPPLPQDYQVDLQSKMRTYRCETVHIPSYALSFMATAARRALYAEDLLRLVRECNDVDEVQSLLASSAIPL